MQDDWRRLRVLGDEDAFFVSAFGTGVRSCLRKEAAGALVLDARRLAAAEVVIARRIVRLAIKRIDPDARPEMRHVERVLSCVAEGTGSVTLPAGIDARIEFGMLAFKAPVAREGLVADWVTVPGRLPLGGGCMLVAEPMVVEPGCDIVRRAVSLRLPGK